MPFYGIKKISGFIFPLSKNILYFFKNLAENSPLLVWGRRIARLHAKAKHQRNDFLHKLSKRLVNDYDIIGIEDLDMKGMSQALNFGKSVMDKGWGMFVSMLSYKSERAGRHLVRVSKWYPSSQTCHECGTVFRKTKDLSIREWTCPHCGHHHDRDVNAALNIRDEAVRILLGA